MPNQYHFHILDSKNIYFSSSEFWSENQKALGFFKDADPLRCVTKKERYGHFHDGHPEESSERYVIIQNKITAD